MMNNQFNAANLTSTQPHGVQMAQHVATSPPQNTSAAVLNTFYNAQHQQQPQHHHHQQQQQQQQFAVAAAGGLYGDPRQLQLTTNPLDKTYYATAGTATALGAALGTPQRYYTTASAPPIGTSSAGHAAAHPNTILITNNFTHQQTQPQSPEQQRVSSLNPGNIRIVTSSSANPTNLSNSSGAYQQAQHVFNLNNTKALQHLFPQHMLQQQQQNFQHAPELIAQHFPAHHYPGSQNATQTTASAIQMPQYYVAADSAVAQLPTNPKILANMPTNAVSTANGNAASSTVNVVGGNANANGSSTVVLDRINICINNLYTDTSSSSASNSLASTPAQQPSPIIPAIQHKAIIENGPLIAPGDLYESSVLVIDEPDSTTTATTPHTPPTTPENTPPSVTNNANATNNNTISTTSSINSPSTSSCSMQQQDIQISNTISTTKQNFASVAQNIEEAAAQDSIYAITNAFPQTSISTHSCTPSQTTHSLPQNAPLTPPTPPSPEISNMKLVTINLTCPSMLSPPPPPPTPLFANGEDVFIKRQDGRFYLGTVIDTARNQFLVRFDDKTEQWCNSDEMRKLGGATCNSTTTSEDKSQDQPMCVACKKQQPDSKVEICERCGRGYHRKCTMETATDSGVWLCKRCEKPMKLSTLSDDDDDDDVEMDVCRQLPYDLNSLAWDSKHRVNEQQIYCYCGKAGKFDHNMLQCCRCLNWYHTECTQRFKGILLRGDVFFVFSCSVCNDGDEYLRRLQLDWVDLIHLIIYNLSTMKKHQNHKYHHLLKDIYPFALEKRKTLPMPKEWVYMPENDFLGKIKSTLKENTERFVCGKEIKRDHYFFALRTNGPPFSKPIPIKRGQMLNDDFIVNCLKLQLLPGAPENIDVRLTDKSSSAIDVERTPTSKPKSNEDSSSRDIYAFEDTSDDEIPIKLILDKVKKKNKSTEHLEEPTTPTSNKTTLEKMDVADDNANDVVIVPTPQDYSSLPPTTTTTTTITPTKIEKKLSPKKETKPLKSSSETASTDENNVLLESNILAATATAIKNNNNSKHSEKSSRKRKAFTLTKSYDKQRLFDSSSDENSSSSSRCTSLDLIIPPPKNFLGHNNPFRVITPKKKTTGSSPSAVASLSGGKKSVSFGIFNTSVLNFSSKLFPKLSTSNLAKAAGQPRTVRTIKRRLSAKDITIGPNQEVRRRRIRRLSANIEVISTTTINPIPTNFFPIHAKDLLAAAAASSTTAASLFNTQSKPIFSTPSSTSPTTSAASTMVNSITSANSCLSPKQETTATAADAPAIAAPTSVDTKPIVPTHGRRLRQRPPKSSPNTSRRNSVSSNQSSTSSSTSAATPQQTQNAHQSHEDLKQTVNKYFGIVNRIESGEQFSIRAKRKLSNGQMQFLIEWGNGGEQQSQPPPPPPAPASPVVVVAESATIKDPTQQINSDVEIKLISDNNEVKDIDIDSLKEIQHSTE